MSSVAIQRCDDSGRLPERLWNEVNDITDHIRREAFSLYERRGGAGGSDLQNWLDAQREVVWSPPSEVVERDHSYRARVAVPGFDPRDLHVFATPDALIIQGEKAHSHEGKDGTVRLCEFSSRKMFRRIDLPSQIDVRRTMATVENGMLQVDAPKSAAA